MLAETASMAIWRVLDTRIDTMLDVVTAASAINPTARMNTATINSTRETPSSPSSARRHLRIYNTSTLSNCPDTTGLTEGIDGFLLSL
ncbi:MAG: hypothetical protein R3320_04640 [Nitriliruptorales bacterium]|nr:hypothetical protein [Nitriliruptorales bacterium]